MANSCCLYQESQVLLAGPGVVTEVAEVLDGLCGPGRTSAKACRAHMGSPQNPWWCGAGFSGPRGRHCQVCTYLTSGFKATNRAAPCGMEAADLLSSGSASIGNPFQSVGACTQRVHECSIREEHS
eukprot:6173383-Amphidinium_carterae.1